MSTFPFVYTRLLLSWRLMKAVLLMRVPVPFFRGERDRVALGTVYRPRIQILLFSSRSVGC